MKANYILTPNTLGVFTNRFNKLLGITGMLESSAAYTGRKNLSSPLTKAGIKGDINQITKTATAYIDADTMEFDSYPSGQKIGSGEGLIIRINDDCCSVIYWGQKMKWRPNQVVLIGEPKMEKYRTCGSLKTFRVCHNVNKGKDKNRWENQAAAAYWAEVEEGLFD